MPESLDRQRKSRMDALETDPEAPDKLIAQFVGVSEKQIRT